MKKTLKRIISLILIASMVLAMPLHALGQGLTDNVTANTEQTQTKQNSSEDIEKNILYELTEKRDSNTKHFLMSDGTMMAAQYENAVHFETQNGWEQYDNSMIVEDETASDENKEYVNKKSDQTVKLAKKAKANKTVTYKYQDYEISWGYQDSEKAELEFVNTSTEKSGNDRFLVLDNITQQAKYTGIFTNVDLELVVSSDGIKENFILNSAAAQNEFVIEYKLKNLTAEQKDEKNIVLKNADGEEVYILSAPVMYDAEGNASDAITFVITEQKNNKLTVTLTADSTWLYDETRVYPVTVDPSFYTTTRSENLKAITVYTGTAPAYSKTMLYASDGNYGGFGKTVSVVKFETLPQLNPGDVVIDAQLTVFRNDMESTSSKVQVYASRVDSLPGNYDTAQYRAKWDSAFSYSSRIEDYEIETGSSSFQQRNFNITKSVKEWYSGEVENNGICLSSYCATTNWYYVRYCLTNYSRYIPAITITYRNAIGLESYWTYHSQSVGHGNAFINDFSGNLVYQLPIFNGTGVKNPASFSFYYNSNISNAVGGTAIAKGWTSNFGQRIINLSNSSNSVNTALVSNDYHYAYVDADETYHYLKKKSNNVYVDEDGLKLTLNVDPASATNRYTLKFNSGEKCIFGSGGNLLQIVDSLGIAIRLEYDANVRLTRIQDGAGRIYNITWENGLMTKVTEPDGSVITISYNSSSRQLEQVTYADGTYTRFAYNTYVSEGQTYYRLSRVTAFNGSYLDYIYRTASLGYAFAERTVRTGIASVTEYAYDSTINAVTKGATLSIKHNNDTSATFTYTRGTVSNSEMYVFDALGRSTSVLYSDGSATDLTYTATASGQSGSDTNNRISSITSGDKISDNLLKDGNLEKVTSYDLDYWTRALYNGMGHEDFYGDVYIGNGVYLAGYGSGVSGFKQRVYVYSDQTYTFSAYAKGENANLFVAYEIDGNEVLQPLRSSVPAKNGEWTRLSLTFTVPENVSYVWVIFGHENSPNSRLLYFDNLQLERDAEIAGNNNLLENPKFYNRSDNWKLKDADPSKSITAGSDMYGNLCAFDGNVLYNTKLSQTVNINKQGVAFKSSVLAKVQSTCIEGTKTCALKALVTYTDNTTQTYSKNFNTFSTAQQRVTLSFVPDTAKTVKSVEYIIDFSKNIGRVTLYETSLEMDETSSGYAYDQNGNMVTSKDSSGKENDYVYYNDTDLVAKSINSIGEVTYASYDSQFKYNPLVQWSAQTSLGTFYTYNSNGTLSTTTVGTAKNIVANDSTKTYSAVLDTSKPYIRTSVGYDSTGNYVTSSTDSRGNISTSNIDHLNGRLNSQTNAAGVTTNYTYDDVTKLLTEISSQDSSVKYSYDSNRYLKSIETGSLVYFFEHDKWGNTTKTKVGNTTLATTEYVNATSLPSKLTYGNGTEVSYSYDKFDRITEKYFGNALAEKYVYNNSGLIGRYTDMFGTANSPLTTVYNYDLRKRLIGKFNQKYSVNYGYDSLDRTTAIKYNINGITFNTGYTYGKDSLLTGSALDGVYTQSYSYDSLNRVTAKNTTVGGSVLLSDSYTYLNNADGSTTTLVSGYTNGGKTYNYTYDVLGNITSETVGGVTKQYTYDSLGQVIKITEGTKVTEYTYDNAGNILSKKEYNNNTAYGTSTQYEQETDVITYVGNWATVNSWYCSNHSLVRTRDSAAYATFDFTGTKLTLLTYKSPTRGVLCYQIDNGEIIEYDCTAEETDVWFKYEVVLADNLDPFKPHTVKIFPKSTNGNLWIDIDALIVTNGDKVSTYTYGNENWGDQLTSYNGQTITYDSIGNPLSYKGATLTWVNGRRLASYTKGTDTLSFTYNASGLRTSKTVNGVVTEYIWDENTLLAQTTDDDTTIYFIYDIDGVLGFKYGDETYYYTKNLQGDIVGIRDSIGNDVVQYCYDDWGNLLSITGDTEIGEKNPIRYRGYYYDHETGLYYVSSRYYDPEVGRFINADNNFSNYNLFMYCGNNPVNRIDPNGEHWYYLWIDDLFEAVDELMASVSNIVYGRAAHERSYYDPKGANDLWNTRPFQDTTPSQEMQIFTEFMYDHDFVADINVSVSIPKTEINVKVGASKVLSPNKNIDATYVHAGLEVSTPSVLPINISCSVGIVSGVKTKENYAKDFWDIGAGAIFGFDYCFWPNGASAYSVTLGTSYGVYGGYDYYWCLD